ncbi:MAG: GAF domain-containing protein [Deltaproteobacteria bacterium]|nr:GAF domain-containing protein [Deltaproteobacteria bacterium]
MPRKALILLGILLFGVGILASVDLPNQQPRLPVSLGGQDGLVVSGPNQDFPSDEHLLEVGDRVVSLNGIKIKSPDFMTFILDGMRVADHVQLEVIRAGKTVKTEVVLVPFLTTKTLVISLIVTIGVWLFGMLIVIKGSLNRDVLLFYGQAMTLSMVMFVYWPENTLGFSGGDRFSWFFSNGFYPFTVALTLHFAIVFPEKLADWHKRLVPIIYFPTAIIAGWLIWGLANARNSLSHADFEQYQMAFSAFRVYLACYFIMSPMLWAWKYIKTDKFASRQRIKWLFWGFTMGISPHILFHELPKGLGFGPILPEEVTHFGALLASASVTIAIIRYRVLDVDFVIRKSLVYFFLTLFVVFAYLLLVGFGDWIISEWLKVSTTWVRITVVMLLAALFSPVRNFAQTQVDRIFFRSQYDQRIALMEYSHDLARAIDIDELSDRLSRLLARTIPTDSLRIFVTGDDGQALKKVYSDQPAAEPRDIVLDGDQMEALGLEENERAFIPPTGLENLQGCAMLVPLRLDQRLVGLIALGQKRSSQAFNEEDFRFVNAVSDQTAVAFETARAFKTIKDLNVSLEQKVFERTNQLAEANDNLVEQYEKLKSLDELKEALTRMVVHDLRNPLSTIMLGMEFLDLEEVSRLPGDVHNTLKIIRNTVCEMQDLIVNMLDTTRLESGNLSLVRQATSINDMLSEGVKRVKVLAKSRQVALTVDARAGVSSQIDRSLMTRVLVNLLTNAIKFSPQKGEVNIYAGHHRGDGVEAGLCIAVANNGPVIPEKFQAAVFDKFFQVKDNQVAASSGVGLGLAFCKLVVETHGGRINLESPAPGLRDGARFSIVIPD